MFPSLKITRGDETTLSEALASPEPRNQIPPAPATKFQPKRTLSRAKRDTFLSRRYYVQIPRLGAIALTL